MLKFICKNGEFEISNLQQSINFQNGSKINSLIININSEKYTLDEIAAIISEPEMVKEFRIFDDKKNLDLGTYTGYTIGTIGSNISEDTSPVINLNFSK